MLWTVTNGGSFFIESFLLRTRREREITFVPVIGARAGPEILCYRQLLMIPPLTVRFIPFQHCHYKYILFLATRENFDAHSTWLIERDMILSNKKVSKKDELDTTVFFFF